MTDTVRRARPEFFGDSIPGYEVLVEIAKGSSATVYRGVQAEFARDVAVKVIDGEPDGESWRRFERECHAIGALSEHPSIVNVFEAGKTLVGRPFIVMELLARGSLADAVRERGPLDWSETLAIGVRIADALDAAHRAGILHRDVKPANVLVSRYGEPKLGDFGIARLRDHLRTDTGVVSATVAHAAPEILAGYPPTAQADVYSLCSTLFTLLTGSSPFEGEPEEPVARVLMRIASEPAPAIDTALAPYGLAKVLAQGLAKIPSERPEGAGALARALCDVQRAAGQVPTPVVVADANTDHAVEVMPAAQQPICAAVKPNCATLRAEPRDRRVLRKTMWRVSGGFAALLVCGGLIATAALGRDTPTSKRSVLGGTVLFRDQFDSNDSGWATSDDQDLGREQVTSGRYSMSLSRPNATSISDTDFLGRGHRALTHFTDVSVEANAELVSPSGVYGVVCRHDSRDRLYEAVVGAGGAYGIFKVPGLGVSPTRLSYQPGPIVPPVGEWHNVALECRTSEHGRAVVLTLRLDRRALATVTDRNDPIMVGAAGLNVASQSQGPAWALFDDFTVRAAGRSTTG